jgi:hypothetical protein
MAEMAEMERSKEVYAVLGMLCLSETYRNDFFANPHAAANRLVGSLTPNELQQLERVAGVRGITGDTAEYVRQVKDAFGQVYAMLRCPVFPCPKPDPFAA